MKADELMTYGFRPIPRWLYTGADSPLRGNLTALFLYTWLMCRANIEEKEWNGVTISPGQLVTGLSTMAQETGLTVKQIRGKLKALEKAGLVVNMSTSKYRIITILFWNELHSWGKSEGNETGSVRENKRAITRNKKDETLSKSLTVEPNGFPEFWQRYPKRCGKQEALRAWQQLNPGQEMITVILAALALQKESRQWKCENHLQPACSRLYSVRKPP